MRTFLMVKLVSALEKDALVNLWKRRTDKRI